MVSSDGRVPDLINETAVNVVALLKEPVGSKRVYAMRLDAFPLADDLQAARLSGEVRLTKLRDEILGAAALEGQVHLECVRCLRMYVQDVTVQFEEEYRQTVDVWTGAGVQTEEPVEVDVERFAISPDHEVDLAEAIRQHLLLALPMRPDCGDVCPGPDAVEAGEEPVDDRLAALAALLEEQP
ncbi:MAG TPA: DUF177 domain-containing protein [Thermomicrobiales bacterium]|nr:DUF177 domain-containing protein [Thermomicrobiales bacterium]